MIDLGLGRAPTEGEAQRAAGPVAVDAHSGEHVRRLLRAGGARRRGAGRDPDPVEEEQQRLGLDAVEAEVGVAGDLPVAVHGLDAVDRDQDPVDETIAELGDFPVYNVGGGLGVAYGATDQPPAIADYVDAVVSTVHSELGPDKRLLLEPGRTLVANSTVTLYTVQTVKRNVSTWVAVDGGM